MSDSKTAQFPAVIDAIKAAVKQLEYYREMVEGGRVVNSDMVQLGDPLCDWQLVPTSIGWVRVPVGFEIVLYTDNIRRTDVLWRFNATDGRYDKMDGLLTTLLTILPPGLIVRCPSSPERNPNDALSGEKNEAWPRCEYLDFTGESACTYPLPEWVKQMIPDDTSVPFTPRTCRECSVRLDPCEGL